MLGVPVQARARKPSSTYARLPLLYCEVRRICNYTKVLTPYKLPTILTAGGVTAPRFMLNFIVRRLGGTLIARMAIAPFDTKPWLCGGASLLIY